MSRSHSKDRRRQKRRDRERKLSGLRRARRDGKLTDEQYVELLRRSE